MSYRLINANALNGVISNDDYEKVLNAPCIFADLPNGLDGEHYNLQEPILDKIRGEIERLQKMCNADDLNLMAQYSAFGMVLDILDKYKAETEDQE